MKKILFNLEVEDEWPPFAVEGVYVEEGVDSFIIRNAPFFIKNMSVGDVITANLDDKGNVFSWQVEKESDHSTVWVMNFESSSIDVYFNKLRKLGCKIEDLKQINYAAIDVPQEVDLQELDEILDSMEYLGIAVAYPSFRHE